MDARERDDFHAAATASAADCPPLTVATNASTSSSDTNTPGITSRTASTHSSGHTWSIRPDAPRCARSITDPLASKNPPNRCARSKARTSSAPLRTRPSGDSARLSRKSPRSMPPARASIWNADPPGSARRPSTTSYAAAMKEWSSATARSDSISDNLSCRERSALQLMSAPRPAAAARSTLEAGTWRFAASDTRRCYRPDRAGQMVLLDPRQTDHPRDQDRGIRIRLAPGLLAPGVWTPGDTNGAHRASQHRACAFRSPRLCQGNERNALPAYASRPRASVS